MLLMMDAWSPSREEKGVVYAKFVIGEQAAIGRGTRSHGSEGIASAVSKCDERVNLFMAVSGFGFAFSACELRADGKEKNV
jgi:hypothetical protein